MPAANRCILICPLGGDLINDGAHLGLRTIGVLREAARITLELRKQGREVLVVLSAGRADVHGLSKKYPRQPASMAAMMRDYLVERLEVGKHLIVIPQETWGTKAELASVQIVKSDALRAGIVVDKTIVVTARWHTLRTRMNAERILGKVEIAGVEDYPSLLHLIEEGVKIVAEWIRLRSPLFGRTLFLVRGRN